MWANFGRLKIVAPGAIDLHNSPAYFISFATAQSQFWFGIHDQSIGTLLVQFFNGRTSLGSFNISTGSDADLFEMAFSSTNPFDRVVIGPQGGGFAIDNLTLSVAVTSPVPLPAALPLFLSGIGALFAFARRKRITATA